MDLKIEDKLVSYDEVVHYLKREHRYNPHLSLLTNIEHLLGEIEEMDRELDQLTYNGKFCTDCGDYL